MHSNTPSGMFIVDHEKASTPDGVSLRVPHPANADPSWMRDIVGSCNGLLCIRHTLYKRTTTRNFYAFYLLQPITESDESNKLMVLTVGSKSWRSIGSCKDPGWRPQEMVYLNGSLHWHLHPCCLIGAFNIESEQVQEFQLDSALREYIWLGVLGGCLSLTDYDNGGALTDYNNGGDVIVWLMKEYGVAKSWTKAFDIQNSFGLPLKFTKAGELIMTSYARGNFALMTFTPGTSTLEKIEEVGMPRDNVSISLFVPNLVSLKDILLLN
uniref:F-box protein At3g07870-like n=1 Tax=Fragaria vesca subsp. vesca TaxID=101020 RepID=UPI0005C9F0B0|nr:PREDICTED: F-box protein At3g07870-like [Fragaria vesca subsp. vesca]